jgi:virulence-associated protein VapD
MGWVAVAGLGVMQYQRQGVIGNYNSKVAVGKKLEEANFARIQGTIYKQQAELARINTIARTGTSLMTMGSGVSGTNTAQLNMAYPAQYGTF